MVGESCCNVGGTVGPRREALLSTPNLFVMQAKIGTEEGHRAVYAALDWGQVQGTTTLSVSVSQLHIAPLFQK